MDVVTLLAKEPSVEGTDWIGPGLFAVTMRLFVAFSVLLGMAELRRARPRRGTRRRAVSPSSR